MTKETIKATHRRNQSNFWGRFCQGQGIDIGCGDDPLTEKVDTWDVPDGDAQYVQSVPDEKYDFVYSSHCLEHVKDPKIALQNWWRILKPGGFLIFQVPDEDLYEQGFFPSRFNPAHQHTFSICKSNSWSPATVNVVDLIKTLPNHKIVYLNLCDTNYDYTKGNDEDQTWDPSKGVEVSIECVVQKMVDPKAVVKLNEKYALAGPRPMVIEPPLLAEPRQYQIANDGNGGRWLLAKLV